MSSLPRGPFGGGSRMNAHHVALMAEAPHPDAAHLSSSWMFTAEGQEPFANHGSYPTDDDIVSEVIIPGLSRTASPEGARRLLDYCVDKPFRRHFPGIRSVTMGEAWPSGAPAQGDAAELTRTVSTADIESFTGLSGDRNPLHYDAAAAERSGFGEIVVQGGVTSAILNAVVAEKLPGPGTVFLNVNWDFTAPVRPGDTITGRVEVTSVREDKPITMINTTVTRGDGTVALRGSAVCWTMTL